MASDTLTLSEIFYSIQGESSRIGLPCIFVRLSFCNLRCSWCDSEYTFYGGDEKSFDEIFDQIHGYPCTLVEVTGGEPLAQENCMPFIARLCDEGYEALIETSGSIDIAQVDPRARIIMDLKCPGSSMSERNRYKNIDLLKPTDEVKFVIKDRHDYEWAKNIMQKYNLAERCAVLVSPVFGQLENIELAQWVLDDGLDVRYQLQIHKYIWDPQARGV